MKAAIFDLDGVLVDTAKYHFKAWAVLANELGYTLTETKNEHLKGVSRVDSLKQILTWADVTISADAFEAMLVAKNDHYLKLIEDVGPKDALPGVHALLEALKAHNIPIALGSASKNARPILDRLHITSFFDAIVDGNDVTQSKPDPEVFVKGAKALGISADQCLVFEDSQAGIEAALAASMTPIAVGSASVLSGGAFYVSDFETFPFARLAHLF